MQSQLFRTLDEVAVSPKALALAVEFGRIVKESDPTKNWVVCFDWGDERRRRSKENFNDWEDLGAGLDLVAFENEQVPESVLQRLGDLMFAVKIPLRILDRAEERLIDAPNVESAQLQLR